MRRIGHLPRRHPLCPACGYDLVGTVAEGGTRCPECGSEFRLHELVRQRLPGDWTPWRGLRIAAGVLALRSALCLPLWAGFVWLMAMGLNSIPLDWRLFGVLAIGCVIPGVMVGRFLGRDLAERAGFAGVVVSLLGSAFAWAVVALGVLLAGMLVPLTGWAIGCVAFTTGGLATLWIVKLTLVDE